MVLVDLCYDWFDVLCCGGFDVVELVVWIVEGLFGYFFLDV